MCIVGDRLIWNFMGDGTPLMTQISQDDPYPLPLKNQTPIGQSPKTVKYYDDFILALEMKRDVVAADPAQNKIIEESDWLDKINTEITLAKAKRDELIKTTK